MCFNASVSFTAGAVIGAVGLLTLKKSKGASQTLFASIPFIFAVQQITEGFLWLVLKHQEYLQWQQMLTVIFIVFAQIVWPFWVPLSIMLMEKNKKRKTILKILFFIGLGSSLFGAYRLLFHPVTAIIEEHHIKYVFNFSGMILSFTPLLYILPTIISLFISSVKKMLLLGILILISVVATEYFFHAYLLSVWCCFAAVISGVIFWIIKSSDVNLKTDQS
ncbi:MAG: hypothetical protein IAF38_14590 [Bacteroidia bacterium]|nr:hypothetical protein [Bacteroidia bacterium]